MFERYVGARDTGRRGLWIRIGIAASALAHIGVGTALLVSAWWKIDKLSIDERPVALASIGFATSAPPPLAGERRERVHRELKRIRDTAQPQKEKPDRQADSGGSGDANGSADGVPGGQGDDPNATSNVLGCSGLDCLPGDAPPPPPKEDPPKPPPLVPEHMLKGHLVAGETQIQAPRAVKLAMARAGKRRVIGAVKLCIDRAGAVSSSRLVKSTGYPSYDRALLAGVRGWRYRPYRMGGKAVAVCTAVQFIYILHRD